MIGYFTIFCKMQELCMYQRFLNYTEMDNYWNKLHTTQNIFDKIEILTVHLSNTQTRLPPTIQKFTRLKSLSISGMYIDQTFKNLPTSLTSLTIDCLDFDPSGFIGFERLLSLKKLKLPMVNFDNLCWHGTYISKNLKPLSNHVYLSEITYTSDMFFVKKMVDQRKIYNHPLFTFIKHRIQHIDLTFTPFTFTIFLLPVTFSFTEISVCPQNIKTHITFLIWCLNQKSFSQLLWKYYLPTRVFCLYVLKYYFLYSL